MRKTVANLIGKSEDFSLVHPKGAVIHFTWNEAE
jgi:hypothetical protein